MLGLAFKPGTDDVRESPAFPIIAELTAAARRCGRYDPVASETGGAVLRGKTASRSVASLDEALAEADAAILVTRWEDFRDLPELLAAPIAAAAPGGRPPHAGPRLLRALRRRGPGTDGVAAGPAPSAGGVPPDTARSYCSMSDRAASSSTFACPSRPGLTSAR